jgi:hypothetical protein
MARRFKKSGVQDIIKSLVDSEIPEIQAVAKQLTDWTKQLEEHSWKLQHYASEIESLAAAEDAEARGDEVSLAELVKDLENTLSQLRGGPGKVAALPEGKKMKAEIKPVETEVMVPEEPKEVEREERTVQLFDTYTTPEGFVVRRVRH